MLLDASKPETRAQARNRSATCRATDREPESLEGVLAVSRSKKTAVATGKAVATGQAYKMLRKVLDVQCNDKYLEHCSMQKGARKGWHDRVRVGGDEGTLH